MWKHLMLTNLDDLDRQIIYIGICITNGALCGRVFLICDTIITAIQIQ